MENEEMIKKLISSVFINTVTEISNTKTFDNLQNETLFLLNDNTFNNIITIKYENYKFIRFNIEKELEDEIRENIVLSKIRKSFSIDIIYEKNVNIISIPVQKKSGEMILFISLVMASEPSEMVILFMEMLVNNFYKNLIIEYIINNLRISESLNNKVVLQFSYKEERIVGLLSEGLEDKQICNECNISISTLRKYISKIFQDLEVRNRTEFVNKYNMIKIAKIYESM